VEGDTSYIPYVEWNENTEIEYNKNSVTSSSAWYSGVNAWETTTVFNVDGYEDTFSNTLSIGATVHIWFVMWGYPSDMQTNGINEFTCKIEFGTGNYELNYMGFMSLNSDLVAVSSSMMAHNPLYEVSGSGIRYFNHTVTTTELNNAVSWQSERIIDDDEHIGSIMAVEYTGPSAMPIGTLNYIDMQWETDYYQVNETSWNNQTITTYEPYIQSITPYAVHKVSMGLGGILILGFGWIASPFNKSFNNFIPINGIKRRWLK